MHESSLTFRFCTHLSKAPPTRISFHVAQQTSSLIGCLLTLMGPGKVRMCQRANVRALGSELHLFLHLPDLRCFELHLFFSFFAFSHVEQWLQSHWALCNHLFHLSFVLQDTLSLHDAKVWSVDLEKNTVQGFSLVDLVPSSSPHVLWPLDLWDSSSWEAFWHVSVYPCSALCF